MKIYPTYLNKFALLTVVALLVAAPAWADVSISVSPDVPSPSDEVVITVSESGTFPNSCLPFELNAEFAPGFIDLSPAYDPNQICSQALTENQYSLSVNVGALSAGQYTIRFFSTTAGLIEKIINVNEGQPAVSISVFPEVPTSSDEVVITVSESGTFPSSCLPFQLDAEFTPGFIDLSPAYDPNQICSQALTENQYTLSVNVGILSAGNYTIRFFSSTAGLVEKNFSVEAFNNPWAGCATYNFFNGILRIPDLTLGDLSYWLDFQIVGINPLVFALVDIGYGESTEQSATLDFDTFVFSVPCLNVGDSYWSEWQLLPGASGTHIELIGYGYNDLYLGENP